MAKPNDPPKTLEETLADVHTANRRLARVAFIFMTIMLIGLAGLVYYQDQSISHFKNLAEETHQIAVQNKTLNQQNKKLAQDNQSIAEQNRDYTKCLATIFAQYTHDFVPVTITNLDSCTINSQGQRLGLAPTITPTTNKQQGPASPSTKKPAVSSTPANSTPPTSTAPITPPSTPTPVRQPLLCTITLKLLGCK